MDIKVLLNSLYEALDNANHPGVKLLQEGLKPDEIRHLLVKHGIEIVFNDDLLELYSWKNGLDLKGQYRIGEKTLFPFGIFPPLVEAFHIYNENGKNNKIWPSGLFPLFNSGGGDYLLIDLREESPTYRMIFCYSPMVLLSTDVVTMFDSLETLLVSVLECYRQYAYYIEDNMLAETNDADEICARFNPLSMFWKSVN